MSKKNKKTIVNHFVDVHGNTLVFNLMDPNLPAWNYAISGQTGSGKSVLSKSFEEIFQEKLAKDNELFDHFIKTGDVIKEPIP